MRIFTDYRKIRGNIGIEIYPQDIIGHDNITDQLFKDSYDELIEGVVNNIRNELEEVIITMIKEKTESVLLNHYQKQIGKIFGGKK